MALPQPPQRFGALDAVFLNFESKEMPLHIGGVGIFDGVVPYEKFVALIESKLDQIPRYRQKVVRPFLDVGYPTWQYDPDFDIRRHIFHLELEPPGTEEQLRELTGQLFTPMMDREKPLWELYVVDGLEGGRSAIITKVHHCMVDGVAGIALLNVMMETSPEEHAPPAHHKRYHPPKPPDATSVFMDAFLDSVRQLPQRFIDVSEGLVGYGSLLAGDDMAQLGTGKLMTMLPELLGPLEKLPFNRPCSGERRVYWSIYDFQEARAVKKAAGGSINDVVLTVIAGAVSRYCKLHGQTVRSRFFRAMVPVNLRPQEDSNGHGAFGNRISLLPVTLPLGTRDPIKRLQQIHGETEAMKGARTAELVRMGIGWLGLLPPPVQALACKMDFLNTFIPLFHMVCTNVPGPQFPLYAAGKKMLCCYPYVPTGMDVGVSVAVESYDGKLYFGLTTDAQAAPDAERMKEFMDASWLELRKAAKVAAIHETPPKPAAAKRATAKRAPRKPPARRRHEPVATT